MTCADGRSRLMYTGLLEASHVMALEKLPDTVVEHAAAAGLHDVLIYLSDLQRTILRLLPGTSASTASRAGNSATQLHIDGTMAGRSYQLNRVLPAQDHGEGVSWWVPLLDGTERIGVLRVTTADPADERTQQDMRHLASLVALIVVSKRGHSDSHARLVRTEEMNVAAEMQWNLMPPRTYADSRVVVSASMEPAYQISGDAYDYAVADDLVHLAIFDAMGHDTAAGLTANLAVGACRNQRRQGASLIESADAVEEVLVEQFHQTQYATGILADLNTRTGVFSWVNRGHHPPVVIRRGRWTSRLDGPPAHPMGTALGLTSTLCREQLEPGDRIVLYTDGITEARRPGEPEFGLVRFLEFLIRHHADGLPVPETLRRLVHAILDHNEGQLQDDATVLLCEWKGPPPHGDGP